MLDINIVIISGRDVDDLKQKVVFLEHHFQILGAFSLKVFKGGSRRFNICWMSRAQNHSS